MEEFYYIGDDVSKGNVFEVSAFQTSALTCRFDAAIWRRLWSMWPDEQIVFSIFGHLQQRKFAQKYTNCAKLIKNVAKTK